MFPSLRIGWLAGWLAAQEQRGRVSQQRAPALETDKNQVLAHDCGGHVSLTQSASLYHEAQNWTAKLTGEADELRGWGKDAGYRRDEESTMKQTEVSVTTSFPVL